MTQLPLDGMRILLMEDEALIAMDVEELCRESGAAEVVVMRQIHAGASLDAARFSGAIVDLMLGGIPTLDFARRLTAHRVPFIFATGYTDRDSLFNEFPDIRIVEKPYMGVELVEALADAISGAGTGR